MRLPNRNAGPESAYWFSRLFIAGSSLIATLLPLLDSGSYDRLMLADTGPVGMWGSGLLSVLCVLLVLDVFGNDFWPKRLPWLRWLKVWRTTLLAFVAIGLCCLLFVFTKNCMGHDRAAYHMLLAWNVCACIALACLDLFARHAYYHAQRCDSPT